MRAALRVLLAVSVFSLSLRERVGVRGASAQAAEPVHPQALPEAVTAIEEEDLDAARAIIEPLLASRPDDPMVQVAAGILRFNEHRYPEAVTLLEKSGDDAGGHGSWLSLARAARDETKDHARAEGEHFIVSYPKGKDEVLVPYVLEALEKQRAALKDDLGYAPEGKVLVELLESPRALSRISPLTEEEIKTSGTIALCKFNKLMVVSPKALLQGYDWLDTAAHEYVHYVVTRRTHDHTPIWLHEGIAKYEETRWRGKGGEALSPFSAALVRDAVKKGKLITFAEMHPSMAKLPSQEAAALAFAEVVLAVEYLQKQGGQPLMNRLLDRIAAGEESDRAVAAALGTSFDDFLSGWKKYLVSRPLPAGGDRELRLLRFKGDPKHGGAHSEWAEILDGRARGFARLGEIFRERGKWEAARVEYGKAVARVGAAYPVLADKFALASMMAGKDGDAANALAQALRGHPDHPALHVHLARLLVKQKQWARAKEELLLANRIDPFDPEIHAGLAQALGPLGDKTGAVREQRFTQILLGRNP